MVGSLDCLVCELGIVRIAVVRHAMRGDDRTKRPSVQREEEGTED